MWKILTFEEKEEFVQILLKCGMSDEKQQNCILHHISRDITQRIRKGNTDRTIVSFIVEKCLEFEDGIEQLVYAVQKECGKTQYWQQLDQCVRMHYPKVISYAEQKDLLAIIGEWPQSTLMRAYSLSKPEGSSVPSFDGTSDILVIILKDLAKFGQSDGVFPILTFIEYLAWYAQKQGKEAVWVRLQSWVNMKAITLHLSDGQLIRLRQKVQAGRSSRTEQAAYLLVMLDLPDGSEAINTHGGEPTYNVQLWLLDSRYHDVGVNIRTGIDNTPCTLDNLRLLLGHVLERCLMVEQLVDIIDDLIVEFLVPDELLNYHFDRWQVTIGADELILGVQYRVVMRSAKRATTPIYWPAWRKKWAYLRDMLIDNGYPTHLACICSQDRCEVQNTPSCTSLLCSQKDCYAQKRLYAALRGSPIVCLALAPVPSSLSTNGNDVFGTLYITGMPIAIWPRKRLEDARVLAPFLTDESLGSLPRKVWDYRRQAVLAGQDDHVGYYLTLLWDNPNHLPPPVTAQQFSAPARKG